MAALLSMRDIRKSFSGVPVLLGARLEVRCGEVHVLAGENGAGKSTLIKILAGVHTDYSGTIEIDGRTIRFASPQDAARAGISVIHQETSLIGSLSVADNMFLGREVTARYTHAWVLDRGAQAGRARQLCSRVGLDIDVSRPVEDFPLPVRMRIELAKALAFDARIVVMDEPTSALTAPEVETLFGIICDLKGRGTAIIYITHRMEEIFRIGDCLTVLREGSSVATAPIPEVEPAGLIRWMIGRDVEARFPEFREAGGNERMRVENLSVVFPDQTASVRDVSFSLHEGEILGIAGLQGSGAPALLAGIFGAYPKALVRGQVHLGGKPFTIRSPRHSIRNGLAYVSGDRMRTGLIFGLDLQRNISLASMETNSRLGFVRRRREKSLAAAQMKDLNIRGAVLEDDVQHLSGGNQQKVLLARWIQTSPKVFLMDEPTRGIDVGAKQEIYRLMARWSAQGAAFVLTTSELEELIGLAHRIIVLHRGRVTAEFLQSQVTREGILRAAMGDSCNN